MTLLLPQQQILTAYPSVYDAQEGFTQEFQVLKQVIQALLDPPNFLPDSAQVGYHPDVLFIFLGRLNVLRFESRIGFEQDKYSSTTSP